MACCGIDGPLGNNWGHGGGSGAGFIGIVYLTKGNYTVTVGAGQYLTRTDNDNLKAYYTYPGHTVISGVVNTPGSDYNVAGSAPILSTVPSSVTLNRAGNGGSTSPNNDVNNVTRGAAVYGSYGIGGISEASPSASTHSSGNGYVKVIYKRQ